MQTKLSFGLIRSITSDTLKRKPESAPKPEKLKKTSKTQTQLVPIQAKAAGLGIFSNEEIKIACWNVNGIRACSKKPSFKAFTERSFDVLCFNETKIQESHVQDLRSQFPAYPYQYWSCSKTKLGYSGTAILSKVEPLSWTEGLANHPEEGRVILAEFSDFNLLCTYVPNSGTDRFSYRINNWDRDLRALIKDAEGKGKGVVWIGDLNVIHKEIDIHRLKGNEKYAGATPEERASFQETLDGGLVDSFRMLHPDVKKFSWYSLRSMTGRAKNEGWRIDMAVISESLCPKLKESLIHDDVMGSDHHPIEIILRNT